MALPTDIVIKDITYEVSMARLLLASGTPDANVPTYHVSASRLSQKTGALIDYGANGSIAGAHCRVVEQDDIPKPARRYVSVKEINNHVMEVPHHDGRGCSPLELWSDHYYHA